MVGTDHSLPFSTARNLRTSIYTHLHSLLLVTLFVEQQWVLILLTPTHMGLVPPDCKLWHKNRIFIGFVWWNELLLVQMLRKKEMDSCLIFCLTGETQLGFWGRRARGLANQNSPSVLTRSFYRIYLMGLKRANTDGLLMVWRGFVSSKGNSSTVLSQWICLKNQSL